MDFLPSHPITQPGHMPEAGQWSKYKYDDGSLGPCIIAFVGEPSPDGKFVNVSAVLIKPPRNGHPGGFTYGGWQYEVETGMVLYKPCGPPW